MSALTARQILALAHRSRQREDGDNEFANGVNNTATWLAVLLDSYEDNPCGLRDEITTQLHISHPFGENEYRDGVAAAMDDIAGILANDPDVIGAIIYRGRTQARANQEA